MTGAEVLPIPRSVEKPSAYAWVILAVLYITSVASALNQFKVPPVLPVLIREFNLSLSNAGMLMSIFSFTGILLALPAGFIMQRLGLKTTGLIAVGAVFIGSSLGMFCSTANAMLATRFIEGAGIGLITIVAPAAISIWFPAEKRGTPLGLWTTCMPVGSIIMFNLAPWLAELGGWQFAWRAGAASSLAAFILFWGFFRMPKPEEVGGNPLSSEVKAEHEEAPGYGKAMANAGLWLITLQFLCFNLICLALSTYYPTFLNTVRNYSLPAASFTFSLCTIAAVFSQPLGGYLSDRLGMRRPMIIISSVVLSVICMFPFIATRMDDSSADYRVGCRRRDHRPCDICRSARDNGIAAVGRIGNGRTGFGAKSGNVHRPNNVWKTCGVDRLDRRRIFPNSGVCNQRDRGFPSEVSVRTFSQPRNSPNKGKPAWREANDEP